LKKFTNLSSLDLDLKYNLVEVVKIFSKSLAKLNNRLTTLNLKLGRNQMRDEKTKFLGEGLSKLINLTCLDLNLGSNQIGCEGVEYLGKGLSKLSNLTCLDLNLGSNQIRCEGAKSLGKGLRKLSNLIYLDLNLRSNQIGPEGAEELGESLRNLTNLAELNLDLWWNQIEGILKGAEKLTRGLSLSKSLYLTTLRLNLWGNQIQNVEARSLCTNIKSLCSLTYLVLNLDNTGHTTGQTYADALVELITEKHKQRLNIFVIEDKLSEYLDPNTHVYHLILDFFLDF
jgi:NLR family CARD domain-containing protein 3